MTADYDRLFQPPEGGEIPDAAAAEPDFDIDLGFDISPPSGAAPASTSQPGKQGDTAPPMPVEWNSQPPPARPVAPTPMPTNPGGPNGHARPPMPVEGNGQPPPARPKPPPVPPGPQPAAPSQHSRHARPRQNPRDAAEAPRGQPATPPHSHRAGPRRNRDNGTAGRTPPSQRSLPPPPPPPTGQVAAQAKSLPPQVADDPRARPAVSHIGVKPAGKPAGRAVSQRGWRRWLHKLTRINVGLSRDEKYELNLRNRIRRTPHGPYQIAILGLKGGAGKTTVTVALGSAFAQVRSDRVLAVDADASCGNLADRAGHQSAATVADLLAEKDLTHYNNVRAHTSANAVNLEVLAAQDYSTARRAFSEADWHQAIGPASRFYNLVLADCGAGLFDPVTRGVLSTSSAAVIVTNASIDGARQAAVAIDWLRNHGHQELLARTCVVINHVFPGETNIDVAQLVRQFRQYVEAGRVIVLPWDKHIAAGTEIQFGLLDPAYKRMILELAAALSDDFERHERR